MFNVSANNYEKNMKFYLHIFNACFSVLNKLLKKDPDKFKQFLSDPPASWNPKLLLLI